MRYLRSIAAFLLAFAEVVVQAQVPAAQPPQYGPNVTNEQAHRALAASIAEARRMNLSMAVAVVDNAGLLVAFERTDNAPTGSVLVSQDKASSAALFRLPTKVFQDVVASGGAGLRILTLRGAIAVVGGVPLVVDGHIAGGLGVSGGTADQDAEVARVGVASLGR